MSDRWDIVSTRKGREGKNVYHRIGVMFTNKEGNGYSIKLDSLPIPNDKGEVWLSAYVPRPKEGAPQQRNATEDLDDSMPF
jgi:hypothetical protein